MFTEKDLVAGETVLTWKEDKRKVLYLGSAGLVHFISRDDEFKKSSGCYFTIDDLNEYFTIEQPKSNFKIGYDSIYTIEAINKYFTIEQPKTNAVPLEKKVYDFVPVRCRDDDKSEWENYRLVAVADNRWNGYQYFVIDEDGDIIYFRYCEFLNQQ